MSGWRPPAGRPPPSARVAPSGGLPRPLSPGAGLLLRGAARRSSAAGPLHPAGPPRRVPRLPPLGPAVYRLAPPRALPPLGRRCVVPPGPACCLFRAPLLLICVRSSLKLGPLFLGLGVALCSGSSSAPRCVVSAVRVEALLPVSLCCCSPTMQFVIR